MFFRGKGEHWPSTCRGQNHPEPLLNIRASMMWALHIESFIRHLFPPKVGTSLRQLWDSCLDGLLCGFRAGLLSPYSPTRQGGPVLNSHVS